MSLFPQRCKVCRKRDKFDFHVTDEIWRAVVPEPFRNNVVCLACFDNFASSRGIDYAQAMDKEICFVGDAAVFNFAIVWREDARKT